jgi:hypothetical protein
VFRPSATDPDVPLPVNGLVVVMPLIVPVPGNVCPGAKLIVPFGLKESPVTCRPSGPDAYKSRIYEEGFAELLPVGNTCHAKLCATAALPSLKLEPTRSISEELTPAAAVAVDGLSIKSVPCSDIVPPTSSVLFGVALLMPTRGAVAVPACVIAELPRFDDDVQIGIVFAVPVPVGAPAGLITFGCAAVCAAIFSASSSWVTKSAAWRPASDAASAAFIA